MQNSPASTINNTFCWLCVCIVGLALALLPTHADDQPADNRPVSPQPIAAEQIEFFETHIRPVLIKQCYECHNSSENSESGFALDHRDGMRAEGDYGPAFDFQNPKQSLLLKAIRHEVEDLKMPQAGAKLPAATIAHFERWVEMGAPDPRTKRPTADELKQTTSWEAIRKQRQQWWSFQPIQKPELPALSPHATRQHIVDRFVQAQLDEHELSAAPEADRRTLIRRLSFVLTGLPPTPKQIEQFLADDRPDAWEQLVDHLLESTRFGEHWARHWMDWVRYTETHGSEGDPAIPHAYQYRDYLIRALNADVPYDQLVREQIAGDLLTTPRQNAELGLNESAIGTAHWRMVFHGFSPTDPLDEKVRFTDDQINVFSKAFLGLTVSCARCHDHKFDAISQKDYYALFGILNSTRPALIDANTTERQNRHRGRLAQLKHKMRPLLASVWLKQTDALADRLLATYRPGNDSFKAIQKREHVLYPLAQVLSSSNDSSNDNAAPFANVWQQQLQSWNAQTQRTHEAKTNITYRWDLSDPKVASTWYADGNALETPWSPAGEFAVNTSGNDRLLTGIYPAGIYSHRLSTKHRGSLSSPRFQLDDENVLWLDVIGENQASVRYIVQNYPRTGTIYPGGDVNQPDWIWKKFDVGYWVGDKLHIELSTAADAPVVTRDQDRSWFGIREAVVFKKGTTPPIDEKRAPLQPLFVVAKETQPTTSAELAHCYARALEAAIVAWRDETMTDQQALFLDAFLKAGLLDNRLSDVPQAKVLFEEYRRLENEIPQATRVPGLVEADSADQPLFVRGNHKQPAEPVDRRFLEAIDDTPYHPTGSGRLQLADDLLRADNPFTARVIVNRIWNHTFGQGLVRTIDNFGRLGDEPTHPLLLDELAIQFRQQGWSIKSMIRQLVTSETWKQSSEPSPRAEQIDPENRLLSHAHLRRLQAESIRDSLLAVSGQLDLQMFGPGVDPDGNAPRRSVYLAIRRNSLNPFLSAFDAPVPFATKGQRDITNVPAQSLTLLNDPFVIRAASEWAQRVTTQTTKEIDAIELMFVQGLGRPPTATEIQSAQQFMHELARDYEAINKARQEITRQLEQRDAQIAALLEPVRQQILDRRGLSTDKPVADLDPISVWTFETDASDSMGDLHGQLQGNALVENGALLLDGQSHVATASLKQPLAEKTLEVWVGLDNLDQRGGGVMTVQDNTGQFFDAIVFGEMQPRHWLAGSNNFARTLNFGGSEETETTGSDSNNQNTGPATHVVITYAADGTIRGYRNGQPYGKPIRKSALHAFDARSSQVLFGLRHAPAGGNRLLKGKLYEARLYGRALSADEVAASFAGDRNYVSKSEVWKELSESQQSTIEQLRAEITELKIEQQALTGSDDKNQVWADLGHAIFNLKEFIYFR